MYNLYLFFSKIPIGLYNYFEVPYFEFISINYESDIKSLITILNPTKIIKYYPFFQFTNEVCELYGNNSQLIVKIYNYDGYSIPIIKVETMYFTQNSAIKGDDLKSIHIDNGIIQVGTFLYTLKYFIINQVNMLIHDAPNIHDDMVQHEIYITHISKMREYYLKEHSIFDTNIFQEFITDCIGDSESPHIKKLTNISDNKINGKRYVYRYDPSDTQTGKPKFRFPNKSGNIIIPTSII